MSELEPRIDPKLKPKKVDAELEQFRSLMSVPSKFEEGFNWTSLLGAVFISLLMVPGTLYMGLIAGEGNIGPAAQWVTLILFLEVARRAQRSLSKAEMFVLFFMAGAVLSMPFSGLLWNQFYIRSEAATAFGIAEGLPHWFAPPPDSPSYAARSFLHPDWWGALGLIIFGFFFSQLANLVLGYGLFRLTSDIERLPFPMAPIQAQGILALAEEEEEESLQQGEGGWRWRVFSIGGALGLAFGAVYLLLPTVTGALTGTAIQIFPIPFSDFTQTTETWLPAVATGMAWDAGHLIIGMVLPFFAVVGSFIGLIVTMVLNPTLYYTGILTSWRPGDNTIQTMFNNNVDFYFSFGIGVALAIAAAGFYEVFKGLRERAKAKTEVHNIAEAAADTMKKGRGDIPGWAIIVCYVFVTVAYIGVSGYLINWDKGVMAVLVFLGFIYTPLISYVTARLEGIAGQVVEVPMVREASLILSGYQGVAIWFLPLPIANYGQMTVFYRSCELTGTKFTSIWKSTIVLYPVILISSILFANFIWGLNPVPSAVYPFAQKMWELEAANRSIIFSSTLGEFSIFEQAFDWTYVAAGAGFGGALFAIMSFAGAPVFLVYGVVRGLGQSMPHILIPQMIGALLGRYYFRKKLGLKWQQYIPVVAAGFFCGQGLVATVGVGITFLSRAVIQLPY